MAEDFPPVGDPGATQATSAGGGSPIQRFRNWLIDTYNGLFKIVIQPQLPKPRTSLFLALAFVFGLVWAYIIVPVQFYDAGVSQLSSSQRDLYIILVAGSSEAGFYSDADVVNLIGQVENPAANVQRLINEQSGQVQAALQSILPLAEQAGPGTPAPSPGSIITDILSFIGAIVLFVVLVNVISLVWGLLIGGFVERFLARLRPESDEDRSAKATIGEMRRRKELEEQFKQESAVEVSGNPYGAPVMQRISGYIKGRAYDDSFAIEDANDMFLGECGATVAKTIGETGELAAVEIWLFDKEDFVRTLTKVFVSEHAYNDPMIRSELEPKVENPATDLVIARPGAVITLETDQLMMQARIADLQMGAGPLPPNSYFEGLTIQMQAWDKSGSVPATGAPPPTPAAAGLPSLDSYEIGPPPTMPGTTQPSPASQPQSPPPAQPMQPPPMQPQSPPPAQPLQPPPMRPQSPPPAQPMQPPPGMPGQGQPFPPEPDEDDDDPFGGTGDFTPLGR